MGNNEVVNVPGQTKEGGGDSPLLPLPKVPDKFPPEIYRHFASETKKRGEEGGDAEAESLVLKDDTTRPLSMPVKNVLARQF